MSGINSEGEHEKPKGPLPQEHEDEPMGFDVSPEIIKTTNIVDLFFDAYPSVHVSLLAIHEAPDKKLLEQQTQLRQHIVAFTDLMDALGASFSVDSVFTIDGKTKDFDEKTLRAELDCAILPDKPLKKLENRASLDTKQANDLTIKERIINAMIGRLHTLALLQETLADELESRSKVQETRKKMA